MINQSQKHFAAELRRAAGNETVMQRHDVRCASS
jgi:hypothetical protein